MERGQVFGQSCIGLLAKYDHTTHSLRTFQLSLFGEEPELLETLPKSGMTVSGKLWEQTMWVRHTGGRESGLWPTPTAQQAGEGPWLEKLETKEGKTREPNQRAYNPETGQHVQITLNRAAKMWPTPTARDGKSGKGKQPRQFSELNSTVERMWPTPRAQDAKHGAATEWELNTDHAGTRDSLRVQVNAEAGGSLNPAWVEWLMGYSPGWTDLED